MARNGQLSSLGNDSPLRDPDQDKLHRVELAKRLAKSILEIDSSEGFVLALTGPWGSGKTTLLNFMENMLKEQAIKREERLVVIRFNAWWISGSDRFLQHFFKQFQSSFYWKGLGGRFGDFFTRWFSPALKPFPKIGRYAAAFEELLKATKKSDVNDLRQKVDKKLRDFPGRILVIIDDVDRLRSDEILLVFRLVKAIADFPKTIYLLAYDEPVVIQAVGGGDQQAGREYLAKIVQLPCTLPVPNQSDLQELFSKGLDTIIENASKTFSTDQTYLSISDGIGHFLTTPRNVFRFLRLLQATYPFVADEVNDVDFICIQALRQFTPTVHVYVAQNKDLLCNHQTPPPAGLVERDRKDTREAIISAVASDWGEDRGSIEQAATDILIYLFPRLAEKSSAPESESSSRHNRQNLRIHDPAIFDRYF